MPFMTYKIVFSRKLRNLFTFLKLLHNPKDHIKELEGLVKNYIQVKLRPRLHQVKSNVKSGP